MKPKASVSQQAIAKKARFICKLPLPEIPKIYGTLLVCGMGETGQLGLGEDEMEKRFLTVVPTLEKLNIVDISAGGMHSICLTDDGIIYSFGCNDEGALGRNTSNDGAEFIPMAVELPGKAVSISAGDSHSACLLEDGRAFAWGSFRDSHGNMGLTVDGNKRLPVEVLPKQTFCSIGSGADHLVLLTSYGKLYTFGCAEQGQLGRIPVRSVSRESRRGNKPLLCPDLVQSKYIKYIDSFWATTYCTYVQKLETKSIYAFGLNNYAQLNLKKKLNAESVNSPMESNFDKVKKIAGGQHHSILLTTDNKCYAIGRKDYGRLGLGTNFREDATNLQEIPVLKGKNIVDISCGETQSFAVTKNGELYSWGMGSNLQLGTGSEDDEEVPKLIASKQIQNKVIFKVSSGGQHTLVLIKKDKVDVGEKSSPALKSTDKVNAKSDVEKKKPTTKDVVQKTNTSPVITNGSASITVEHNADAKRNRKRKLF